MSNKLIKDPIHGYIEIKKPFCKAVDSVEFQRLKWIEQGSFRVLYPAARHDRFIHSLGTYHLAVQFSKCFRENIKEDIVAEISESELDKIENTFFYAALLHDIGHAPFSHTCEHFYNNKRDVKREPVINESLVAAINSIQGKDQSEIETFKKSFQSSKMKASPHEIVSATILVEKANDFLDNLDNIDLELAARMVIGCTYEFKEKEDRDTSDLNGIKNCYIRLLNSNAVDIDKLDYIVRDTRMSGFSNSAIDIIRLSKAVTAIRNKSNQIIPAFRKNVLSVLESVFRAKTEQNIWIITHPVVIYDSELLKACIQSLDKAIPNYIIEVFSADALSEKGKCFENKHYFLLADPDVITDLKAKYPDYPVIKEYFSRNMRRHPIWKSYFEYRLLFTRDKQKEPSEGIFEYFKGLIDFLESENTFCINEDLKSKAQKASQQEVLDAIQLLERFSTNAGISFDFVILNAKNTFEYNIDPSKIYIVFDKYTDGCEEISYGFLNGKDGKASEKRFFYIYSKDRVSKEKIQKLRELVFLAAGETV